MDKFEEKISALRKGAPIRFTQSNGQIIEGVIAENDGESMVSVVVTTNITLRYSQIVSFESSNAFGALTENNIQTNGVETNEEIKTETVKPLIEEANLAVIPELKAPKKRNIKVPCSEYDIKKAFGAMESDARKAFNPAYGKIQSGMKSHETSKFKEASELIWNEMNDRNYEEIVEVNIFYAYACMLSEEYREAVLSFGYANDSRNAFRAAYQGAEKTDDMELYALAGAFASIYITETEDGIYDEAVETLMYSSEKCSDVSGFEYIIQKKMFAEVRNLLSDALLYLAEKNSIQLGDSTDLNQCINELKSTFSSHQILDEILKSIPDDSDIKEERQEEKTEKTKQDIIIDGKITKYNFFERKGTIVDTEGKTFFYEVSDISDEKLKNLLLSISRWDPERTIPVRFKAISRIGKDVAVAITRVYEAPKPVVKVNVNALFSQGKYEEALKQYKIMMGNSQIDDAFSHIIMCYIALWNKNGDFGYSSELAAFVDKYADKATKNTKNLEALQQYYAKIQNHKKSLEMLNLLLENCNSDNYKQILHYLIGKERCYRILGDIPSAISQLTDWLQIVKRYQVTERYPMRESSVYPELAELYLDSGDLDNAEKYAMLSASEERKMAVLRKIEAIQILPENITDTQGEADDDDDEETDDETSAITLQEAYDNYVDESGLSEMGITDAVVPEKIQMFSKKDLYCLLTWLKAVSIISNNDNDVQQSELNSDFTMKQVIRTMESAFGYAFHSPLAQYEYTSTQIVSLYGSAEELIPQFNSGLMVASILRTLFMPSSQDYYMDDLIVLAEESEYSEKYPMLLNLMNAMKEFYDNTGCAIDSFAGYRSNADVIGRIVEEAKELCKSTDQKNDVFESQGQVRRLREFMFTDEQSELRKCLNVVAENDVKKIATVRNLMKEFFIRKDRAITAENIDVLKLDDYIDRYWDIARDVIWNEGRHVSRPHDKIKGSKRSNVVNTIKKIISCVCDWLAVAERSDSQADAYIKQNYEAVAPKITEMMSGLCTAASDDLHTNGFDWGTEAIRYTACELLSKIKGTYNPREKKYLFIDFLKGDSILLNDDFLPELQSTFCGWGRMNILTRIENHVVETLPSFEERVIEILSNVETKHNFRSLRLIKEYADDTGYSVVSGLKEFEQAGACLKQAKKRFETMYQDFSSEISLYENYGTISDINGEKTAILKLALDWFRITRITTDYGAYARILESLKKYIADNADERAQQLMRQLEELADKPEYDFGVYSKDVIAGHINDHNFTSAEFILNCIRRHDTKDVLDYSSEPFGYFNEFITEHQTNYRAVFGAGKDIVETIAEYSGKKDMELALIRLTNNARKETSGGAAMLRSWLPKGGPAKLDNLQKLLLRLGFNPLTITPEEANGIESYKVYCKKRQGKVAYPHTIPAFGSRTETEGFRVMCLYGKFDSNSLMDKFRAINTTPKHTLVLLDYAMNVEDRRRLARKIKEEKSFSKAFIVIDRVVLFYLAKHYAPDDTIIRRFMAVTLPFSYYQPFVEDSDKDMPPELFTGREDILTKIESPEGANLVFGGRQLGKSALLKMAKRNIDKNGNNDRAILVDVQGKNYSDAALEVSRELVVQGILSENCECADWHELVNHIKKRLMDENPETRINYLLIMLDEADEFIRTSSLDGNPPISATKNLPSDRFKLVMAGLHNLSRFNREMLQGNSNLIHLSHVIVRQFQRPEAIKLLTNTLAYLGFKFDEKVISLILAKTNYYPGLIQFYCQKLLEAMKNEDYASYSESNTPYYQVSESHIKKVLADPDFMSMVNQKLEASLFTEEKGHSYYHVIALVFAFLYYDSATDKKYTLSDMMKVAKDYQIKRLLSINTEKVEELLNEMCDLNVISKEDEYYRFATEGFRELLGSREKVEDAILDYAKEELA